jgi:hypothetical protein
VKLVKDKTATGDMYQYTCVFDKVEFKLAPASGQDSTFSRTSSIEFMANH